MSPTSYLTAPPRVVAIIYNTALRFVKVRISVLPWSGYGGISEHNGTAKRARRLRNGGLRPPGGPEAAPHWYRATLPPLLRGHPTRRPHHRARKEPLRPRRPRAGPPGTDLRTPTRSRYPPRPHKGPRSLPPSGPKAPLLHRHQIFSCRSPRQSLRNLHRKK